MFNITQLVNRVQTTASQAATGQTRRTSRTSGSLRNGLRGDRATVSAEGRVRGDGGFTSRVRSLTSGLTNAFNAGSEGLEANARGASQGIQSASDAGGEILGSLAQLPGRVQAMGTRGGSRLVAGGLRLTGNERAARRVARFGERAAGTQERTAREGGRQVSNFVSGVGDGVGSLVEDVGVMAANPGQTARTLGRLAQATAPLPVQAARSVVSGRSLREINRENQQYLGQVGDAILDEYRQTRRDHGNAGAAGRIVFDVLGIIGTGGTSAGGRVAAGAVGRTVARSSARSINGRFLGQVAEVAENTASVVAPTISREQN